MQKELKVRFESFRRTKDKGIDFRIAKSINANEVLQCKHYVGTGFDGLYNKLKNDELSKIHLLNPTSYYLVTSVDFSEEQKEAIFQLLQPFVKDRKHIYGKGDLNNLLEAYPEVESAHFKLWLTSTVVLERVLHKGIVNQSEQQIEFILEKIKYYVPNQSFPEAKNILHDTNYCIISGNPGIGKTTLAEMLLIDYVDRGYQAIKISQNINEGFQLYQSGFKQVFYYDDFLGETALLEKNEDQGIVDFITRIQKSTSKKFILTTREYILNQAKLRHERLKYSGFDLSKCIINLNSYNSMDKARILYNHLYFSGIENAYIQTVLEGKNYRKIILHRNFTPRLIEWMTIKLDKRLILDTYYIEFIKTLDNPRRMWGFAFEKHISDDARDLLLLMLTLPTNAFINDLKNIFIHSVKFNEPHVGSAHTEFRFRHAMEILENSFLRLEDGNFGILVRYHNPSILDFLTNYLMENPFLINHLLKSAHSPEQCWRLWDLKTEDEKMIGRDFLLKMDEDLLASVASKAEERLINSVYYVSSVSGKTIYNYKLRPVEVKILLALNILNYSATKGANKTLANLFEQYMKILENGKATSVGAANILQDIRSSSVLKKNSFIPEKNFLLALKKFLFSREFNDPHTFSYQLDFYNFYPELFTSDEKEEIKNDVEEFFNDEDNLESYIEEGDPSAVREYIDSIKKFSAAFEIDDSAYEDFLGGLEGHIDALENSAEAEDTSYSNERLSTEVYSENDIDSLFDTLLD